MSDMRDAVGLRAGRKEFAETQYEFEPATGTLWGYMNQRCNPCFNLGLLKEIRNVGNELTANSGHIDFEGAMHKVHTYVAASRVPRVFNLGGDLSLFMLLIRARDREALAHYARLCIDNIHSQVQHYQCPTLTTISLVQGDALGGGLECALSSNVIVAEESAQLGLPEVLFNLFPGMGALSLLTRRIGMRAADEIILSGRVLDARQMHEMGVVDVVAKDGHGENAVQEWIARNRRRQNAIQALFRARQFVHPITRAELDSIVDLWVEAALRLDERDLKMMSRLVRSQVRRMESNPLADATEQPLAALSA